MEILICRLQPWMGIEVARNLSQAGHNVHNIDHGWLDEYKRSGVFKSCHLWQHKEIPQKALEKQFKDIIRIHKIELVIITQKLYLYSNIAEKVCAELNIKVIFTEYFFDDKLIFDDMGLQYTKNTQSIGECSLPIDWPRKDREGQPSDMAKVDMLVKYNVPKDSKVVIIYGQVPWDMSLIESPESITYDEYIEGLCKNNPDTIFLFKPHPKSKTSSNKYHYPNMKKINESLRTLFQFSAHTAYSSTVIFEGVSRGLHFASVGYHLLQNHTHKITSGSFKDIYNKIINYQPDMDKVRLNTSYITNIYTMPMSDSGLADRLINGINQVRREHVLAKKGI
jgi:hypothetical protein